MKLLIKIGGTLLDTPATRDSLARQIAAAAGLNHQIVVVHGGGKQITRFLDERGIPSRFVNGLRVTGPETMDAVVKVLAGTVNKQLVAALSEAGALPVGLCGLDAGLVQAEAVSPELGAVGRVTGSNPALLHLLVKHGYLPVVACIGGNREGRLFNINADQMAAACARAFGADLLLFLTDVGGVLDAAGQTIARLSTAAARELVRSGVAHGGMQAKLEAASAALHGGVARVRIVLGGAESVVLKAVAGEAIGTALEADTAPVETP